jgi:predicted membrane-bound dolichyl-phosphate-mannose-protein mannosyltransferase
MLLAFLFYLKDRYVFSGMSLALSAVCKLTGFLGIFVILAHWLIRKRRQPLPNIVLFLFVGVVAFMVLLPVTDFAATGHWTSPTGRVWQILDISRHNTSAAITPDKANYVSYPWEWILNLKGFSFIKEPRVRQIINPMIWILIIPSMGYMLYEFIKRKTDISLFALLWFAALYLLWIPIVILTDRTTYIYYFYPAVGAVCIAVSVTIRRIWDFASKGHSTLPHRLIKAAVIGYLALYVILFLGLTPIMAMIAPYSP